MGWGRLGVRAVFRLATSFNGNISAWDVSAVTDMDSSASGPASVGRGWLVWVVELGAGALGVAGWRRMGDSEGVGGGKGSYGHGGARPSP